MRTRARLMAAVVAASLVAASSVTAVVMHAPPAGSAAPAGERLSGPLASLAAGGANRRVPSNARVRQRGPFDPSEQGPGSLVETSDGVLVQVFGDDLSDEVVDDLRAAGATILGVDRPLGIATASVAASDLAGVAAVTGVRYVHEVLEPLTSAADGASSPLHPALASAVQGPCGAAQSEGDTQLDAVGLRNAWGTEGYGVEVGVLSDSWNRSTADATSLDQDIASGDIPGAANPCPGLGRTTPVSVLAEGPTTGADEGRGMAQIVHDLAPAAQISFATAFTGDLLFADNIRALRNHGADVIVDDVFYYNEPAYQNGPIGAAVEDVVASGAAYFSALGNETEVVAGHAVSSYETQAFRPMACPAGIVGTCHDFNGGSGSPDNTFGVTVPAGGSLRMSLKWDEPWNGVATDYDLYYVVDGEVVASSEDVNPNGTEQPYEYISAGVGTADVKVDVVVSRRPTSTGSPRFKLSHVRSDLSGSEYTQGLGTDVMGANAVGHPVSPGAVGVGAIPYTNSNTPEPYTNRGPATWYWGPAVGSSPAAPLAAPLVLDKPDVAATDGGRTTFFFDQTPPFTAPRFYGTSAAAPHAAAVAALLRACKPSLTPAQITATLRATAAPVTGGIPANVGSGRVDARAAGDLVCQPPVAVPAFSVSNAGVAEGNGGLVAAKQLTFTVSLSQPLPVASSVSYQTVNGTAVAPGDFTAKSLTSLSFAKGQTSKTVTVAVKGDTVTEPDETMTLRLSNASGAAIDIANGTGTIINDDVPPVVPDVSIGDVSIVEGAPNLFAKTVTFTVTLSAPAPGPVSIAYHTANGSAVAPGDYTAKAVTTLSFSKGQTSKTFTVPIKGDTLVEGNEVFFVLLTSPTGVSIGDGTGIATIIDDD